MKRGGRGVVELWKVVGESSPKCSQNNEDRYLVQVVGALLLSTRDER